MLLSIVARISASALALLMFFVGFSEGSTSAVASRALVSNVVPFSNSRRTRGFGFTDSRQDDTSGISDFSHLNSVQECAVRYPAMCSRRKRFFVKR
jgi:hypothetical protein